MLSDTQQQKKQQERLMKRMCQARIKRCGASTQELRWALDEVQGNVVSAQQAILVPYVGNAAEDIIRAVEILVPIVDALIGEAPDEEERECEGDPVVAARDELEVFLRGWWDKHRDALSEVLHRRDFAFKAKALLRIIESDKGGDPR